MINENSVILAIKSLLESIQVDDEPVIQEVFDHIPAQYTHYPACYVIPVSWQEELVDLRDTSVNAVYRIGIVYTLEPDMVTAQKEIRNTARLVRETLGRQENIQLAGTVDWSQLTSGNYSYDTREQKVAICQIDLAVIKRYSRYINEPN